MHILFRVDASVTIGLGHTMRCLVLAQRLQEENPAICVSFASQELKGNINAKIIQQGYTLHKLKSNKLDELLELTGVLDLNLLIIDSYKITTPQEKQIKENINCKLLVFDDTFEKRYADMVLNHGIQAQKSNYIGLLPSTSVLFTGAQYTLLRDEFFQDYTTKKEKKSIAIILGGNDASNLSLHIATLLKNIDPEYKISIITTNVNPHLKSLKLATEFTLLINIENVAQTLSAHEIIICASGGNLFEVMALHLNFINIQVASNQENIVNFLNSKEIYTTMQSEEITQAGLVEKIEYIKSHNIYANLNLNFSKNYLAKEILKATLYE